MELNAKTLHSFATAIKALQTANMAAAKLCDKHRQNLCRRHGLEDVFTPLLELTLDADVVDAFEAQANIFAAGANVRLIASEVRSAVLWPHGESAAILAQGKVCLLVMLRELVTTRRVCEELGDVIEYAAVSPAIDARLKEMLDQDLL